MKEIPFTPEWMILFSDERRRVGIDGGEDEGNSNTEYIESLKAAIPAAMKELTDRQRQCLEMYFWEGKKQHRIARELGLTRQAVTAHIARGIEQMRKCKHFVKY